MPYISAFMYSSPSLSRIPRKKDTSNVATESSSQNNGLTHQQKSIGTRKDNENKHSKDQLVDPRNMTFNRLSKLDSLAQLDMQSMENGRPMNNDNGSAVGNWRGSSAQNTHSSGNQKNGSVRLPVGSNRRIPESTEHPQNMSKVIEGSIDDWNGTSSPMVPKQNYYGPSSVIASIARKGDAHSKTLRPDMVRSSCDNRQTPLPSNCPRSPYDPESNGISASSLQTNPDRWLRDGVVVDRNMLPTSHVNNTTILVRPVNQNAKVPKVLLAKCTKDNTSMRRTNLSPILNTNETEKSVSSKNCRTSEHSLINAPIPKKRKKEYAIDDKDVRERERNVSSGDQGVEKTNEIKESDMEANKQSISTFEGKSTVTQTEEQSPGKKNDGEMNRPSHEILQEERDSTQTEGQFSKKTGLEGRKENSVIERAKPSNETYEIQSDLAQAEGQSSEKKSKHKEQHFSEKSKKAKWNRILKAKLVEALAQDWSWDAIQSEFIEFSEEQLQRQKERLRDDVDLKKQTMKVMNKKGLHVEEQSSEKKSKHKEQHFSEKSKKAKWNRILKAKLVEALAQDWSWDAIQSEFSEFSEKQLQRQKERLRDDVDLKKQTMEVMNKKRPRHTCNAVTNFQEEESENDDNDDDYWLRTTLQPIEPPDAIPKCPATSSCKWIFNKESRVLLGKFAVGSSESIHPEDKMFLLKMMERDDISVVTEGLVSGLDQKMWDLNHVANCVGDKYHHKIISFTNETRKSKSSSNKSKARPGKKEGPEDIKNDDISTVHEEEVACAVQSVDRRAEVQSLFKEHKLFYSMQVRDYVSYIKKWHDVFCRGEKDSIFIFKSFDGGKITIDVIKTVLYLIDYDIIKLLPRLYEDFKRCFRLSDDLFPGGKQCMMSSVRNTLNLTLQLVP